MNSNQSIQKITAYLSQLRQDVQSPGASPSSIKQKYQIKILQLLISQEQSNMAYDSLNKNYLELKKQADRNTRQFEQQKAKFEAILEQKQELIFQMKAQISENSKLEQTTVQQHAQIQQLKETISSIQQSNKKQQLKEHKANKQQVLSLQQQVASLQKQLEQIKNQNSRLNSTNLALTDQFKSQKKNKQEQFRKEIEGIRNQQQNIMKKTVKQYQEKLRVLKSQLDECKFSLNQQKLVLSKNIEQQQSKIKLNEKAYQQLRKQKEQAQGIVEQIEKQFKQKQKQLKILKKQMSDLQQKSEQLQEQLQTFKSELSSSQSKRKLLLKSQQELRKQLEAQSQKYESQNQQIQKQKNVIKELRQEIKKLKTQGEDDKNKIKQLQSQLYKSGVQLQQQKKKVQQGVVKMQYLQSSNIKMSEKLALEEKHRETSIKSIVGEKDSIQKQNYKLLQLLQVKQNMLRAILESAAQAEQPKLQQLGIQVKGRQKWAGLIKQNLKDPSTRKAAIDKWILN